MNSILVIQSVLYVCAGLAMPYIAKRDRNIWVGIRSSTTLQSQQNWERVHVSAKTPFFVCGLSCAAFALIVEGRSTGFFFAEGLLAATLLTWLALIVRSVALHGPQREEQPSMRQREQKELFWGGIILALTFVLLGAFMPKIGDMGPNDGIGIRTDKLLNAPQLWVKVHNQAHKPTIIVGVAWMTVTWLLTGAGNLTPRRVLLFYAILVLVIVGYAAYLILLSAAA